MDPLSKTRRKRIAGLKQKKQRKASGLFLAEGTRVCEAAAEGGAEIVALLATPEYGRSERERVTLQALLARAPEAYACSEDELRQVSDAESAQGVALVCRWSEPALPDLLAAGPTLLVALDGVGDPGNVGTIARAADWFGADGLLLGTGCAEITNPKCVRASAGSVFHIPCLSGLALTPCLAELRRRGYRVAVADADGEPDWTGWRVGPSALVMGNEARGVAAETRQSADTVVAVPRLGRAESLNVAMAATVLLAGGTAVGGKHPRFQP